MENRDTRERITNAAVDLFAELGYDGVGMRGIAERSGIAVSVIYYYFSGKEKMYTALFLDFFRDVLSGARDFIEANASRDLFSTALRLLELFHNMDDMEKKRMKVAIYEIQGFGKSNELRAGLLKSYRQHEMVFFSLFLDRLKDRKMSFAASRVLFTYLSSRVADIIINGRYPEDTLSDDLKVLCQ